MDENITCKYLVTSIGSKLDNERDIQLCMNSGDFCILLPSEAWEKYTDIDVELVVKDSDGKTKITTFTGLKLQTDKTHFLFRVPIFEGQFVLELNIFLRGTHKIKKMRYAQSIEFRLED